MSVCVSQAGLDINAHLPLHRVIPMEHQLRLKVLLQCGADPSKTDASGQNALHAACLDSAYDYSAYTGDINHTIRDLWSHKGDADLMTPDSQGGAG
jgi:ankyrin repeat protein